MKIIGSPQFLKKLKKLPKQDRQVIDEQVRLLSENPTLGEEKIQDLKGVYVHKFKLNRQQTLLSYQWDESNLYLLSFGSHENYYRGLKKYLR